MPDPAEIDERDACPTCVLQGHSPKGEVHDFGATEPDCPDCNGTGLRNGGAIELPMRQDRRRLAELRDAIHAELDRHMRDEQLNGYPLLGQPLAGKLDTLEQAADVALALAQTLRVLDEIAKANEPPDNAVTRDDLAAMTGHVWHGLQALGHTTAISDDAVRVVAHVVAYGTTEGLTP